MDALVIIFVAVLGVLLFVQVSADWRNGVFFILAVGFAQDLVRKLVPGEPVAISGAVGVVMLFVWGIGVGRFGGASKAMSLRFQYPSVVRAFVFFAGLVFFQAMITIVNFESIPLAGIGLVAYLSPLPAIWVGWWYCRTERDFRQLALTYVVGVIIVALTVYMSWLGADWAIFKSVGEALVFYGDAGIITMHTGFMRAPEITAWHLGAATCFVIVLATLRPTVMRLLLSLLVIALLVSAAFLTGRRKALATIGLFVGIFAVLLQYSRHRDARKASYALFGVAASAIATLYYIGADLSEATTFQVYAQRGGSTYEDAWDRFYMLGIGSVVSAIDQVGFLGLGAGAVSQGAQHFGGDESIAGAAEGGLGKIIVELGIPGLIVITWVLWIMAKTVRRLLAQMDRVGGEAPIVAFALVAFLVANVFSFVTASQVFGDPFVLILMGIAFGALLAAPRLRSPPQKNEANALTPSGVAGVSRAHQIGQLRY